MDDGGQCSAPALDLPGKPASDHVVSDSDDPLGLFDERRLLGAVEAAQNGDAVYVLSRRFRIIEEPYDLDLQHLANVVDVAALPTRAHDDEPAPSISSAHSRRAPSGSGSGPRCRPATSAGAFSHPLTVFPGPDFPTGSLDLFVSIIDPAEQLRVVVWVEIGRPFEDGVVRMGVQDVTREADSRLLVLDQ